MEVQQAAEVRQLNRLVTQRAGYTETAPFSADPPMSIPRAFMRARETKIPAAHLAIHT